MRTGGGWSCPFLWVIQGVVVSGQDEDQVSVPGGLTFSPQDVVRFDQQLVDEVENRTSLTIQSKMFAV